MDRTMFIRTPGYFLESYNNQKQVQTNTIKLQQYRLVKWQFELVKYLNDMQVERNSILDSRILNKGKL